MVELSRENDIGDGEIFHIGEDAIAITKKHWICGTELMPEIQLVACFEMFDLSEDEDDEFPITVQATMLVHPSCYSHEYIDKIVSIDDDGSEYSMSWALTDAHLYGSGIPFNIESVSSDKICDVESKFGGGSHNLRRFKTYEDAEKYIKEVYCHNVNAVMGLVGFYLDQHINLIGTTGWDYIYSMTEGTDPFDRAWKRIREAGKNA